MGEMKEKIKQINICRQEDKLSLQPRRELPMPCGVYLFTSEVRYGESKEVG